MQKGTKGGTITYNAARACDVVRKVAGRWYTTENIPKLPLKDCTYGGICECKYKFYDDPRRGERRVSTDRRIDLRFEPGKDDRRLGRGRRGGDASWKIEL